MSNDIVTRLRQWDDQQPPFQIMMEAANEIERLRNILESVRVERDMWEREARR